MNRRRRGRRGRRESDKGDFVSRDYGPIALALGHKGRAVEGQKPLNGCRAMYLGLGAGCDKTSGAGGCEVI